MSNMLPMLATFVVCIVIVLTVYWLFVVMPEERAGRTLRRRLRPDRVEIPGTGTLTRRAPPLSALKGLDGLSEARDAYSDRFAYRSNVRACRLRSSSSLWHRCLADWSPSC